MAWAGLAGNGHWASKEQSSLGIARLQIKDDNSEFISGLTSSMELLLSYP